VSLRFHPAAQRELDEASAFYEAESPGLGAAFIDEVERGLRQIIAFPQASPLVTGAVRLRVLAVWTTPSSLGVRPLPGLSF
jgi:toxin ParE1/3/4